jgi:Zn-dependent protease
VAFMAMLELTALLFNLLPCPGLDGWGIIEPFLPSAVRDLGRRLAPIAPVILVLALFFVPGLNGWFWQTIYAACAQIGLDPRVAWFGFGLFQFWR